MHNQNPFFSMVAIFQQPRMDQIRNVYLLPFTHQLWISCLTTLLTIHALRALLVEKRVVGADTILSVISNISLQGLSIYWHSSLKLFIKKINIFS